MLKSTSFADSVQVEEVFTKSLYNQTLLYWEVKLNNAPTRDLVKIMILTCLKNITDSLNLDEYKFLGDLS